MNILKNAFPPFIETKRVWERKREREKGKRGGCMGKREIEKVSWAREMERVGWAREMERERNRWKTSESQNVALGKIKRVLFGWYVNGGELVGKREIDRLVGRGKEPGLVGEKERDMFGWRLGKSAGWLEEMNECWLVTEKKMRVDWDEGKRNVWFGRGKEGERELLREREKRRFSRNGWKEKGLLT